MDVSGGSERRRRREQRAARFHPNSLTGEVGIMEGGRKRWWGL